MTTNPSRGEALAPVRLKSMATNLEFKVQCQTLDSLYPRLAALNAAHRETVGQIDTYFYLPAEDTLSETSEPRLKLREIDASPEAWLIYYERPNREASRYSQYQLCKIADPLPFKALLTAALGVKTVVKKRREVWMFNHTRIHLDSVEGLGHFVELETVFQGQTEAEAAREHRHVKTALHLEAARPIAVSYSDLVMQIRKNTPTDKLNPENP